MTSFSYRNRFRHKNAGKEYDGFFVNRVDSLIWSDFVKPFVFNILRQEAPEGSGKYLDFACGTGRILSVGGQVFNDATGIDISESMLEIAKKRVPSAKLLCLDVTRNDTEFIGLFDCVSSFRFLRNAEPALRQEVLEWISAHMSPGGLLVVNNHGYVFSWLGLTTKLAFWLPPASRNLLTNKQTFSMLEKAGFSVQSCEGFQILPGIFGRPVFGRWLQVRLERLCRKLGMGRFGAEQVVIARKL